MQGDNAAGHIVVVAVAKAGVLNHRLKGFLIRVHTNRFGEILVAVTVFGKQLAELGQQAKGIAVIYF